MINRTLHAITNRAGGFMTASLRAEPAFHPSTETPTTQRLRALLGVDRTEDDYHVFAILTAIEACPDIRAAFRDPVRSYAPHDYRPANPVYSGGTPVADAAGDPQCRLKANETPVPTGFFLQFTDPGCGTVRYGRRTTVVPVTISEGRVYPQWPEFMGFSGGVQMSWEPGAVFSARARPVRFPYGVLAAALRADDAKNELLERHLLTAQFHRAPDEVRQVAVAALALGLSNSAVYG